MLGIRNLGYSIGGQPLFEDASVRIPAGRKVGLVGRNGTGKTTLLRLITGEINPDAGAISLQKQARIGCIEQEAPASRDSLLETVLMADGERARLMREAETETGANRIGAIHARLQEISAWSAEARAATILSGLGFDEAAQARACAEFSGGWRMRVALAGILFSAPDVLLLDEPTNYLDLEGTIWLESYLASYPHTVLVISHDRALLNRSVNAILHLSEKKLTLYSGGFDLFDRARREKAAQTEQMRKKQTARRQHLQSYVDRFRYKASKAKQAQSRLKMIERMEPVSLGTDAREVMFQFPEPDELAPPILRLEAASVGYDGTPVLSGLGLRIDQDDRIALLGANGQGKSTLSKLLAGRLELMEGQRVAARKLRVGYFAQHQVDELSLDETPLDHLRRRLGDQPAARARARLASFGLGANQADMRVGDLSGGQKSRLALLLATLDAPHLLILDEPTNHLDIESREALVGALNDYRGAVILVSHDPHLVSLTADRLWLVRNGGVEVFKEDLESYRALLLSERATAKSGNATAEKTSRRPSGAQRRRRLAPLKAEVAKCETRIATLENMIRDLDRRLHDPALYRDGPQDKVETLQRRRKEAATAMARAESLWEQAAGKLEDASKT
ncbi:MAG: ABC-F family ATP-binding cassette domain-containing protein [Paracoccaceae bacterium]